MRLPLFLAGDFDLLKLTSVRGPTFSNGPRVACASKQIEKTQHTFQFFYPLILIAIQGETHVLPAFQNHFVEAG